MQVAAAQLTVVAAWVQAPAPLQVPVFPQVPFAAHCPEGAVVPAASGAQLPAPLTLQAWQVPQLPLPQQTPSVQNPLMHWLAALQLWPFGLSAQLLLEPEPWQVSGATQSPSAVQLVLQVPFEAQTKPPGQADEVGAAQAPVPLQCETGVKVEPVHVAVPHETLVPPSWQCPAPSQAPVLPQGGFAVQRPCGSVLLAGTLAQLPALPVTLHAWQVPHELELQQTPSTQVLPVRQSLVAVQACPRRFLLPQWLVFGSQMSGDWQSASAVHAALQAVLPLQT